VGPMAVGNIVSLAVAGIRLASQGELKCLLIIKIILIARISASPIGKVSDSTELAVIMAVAPGVRIIAYTPPKYGNGLAKRKWRNDEYLTFNSND